MSLPITVTVPLPVDAQSTPNIQPTPYTLTFTSYAAFLRYLKPKTSVQGEGPWAVLFEDAAHPRYQLFDTRGNAEAALQKLALQDPGGIRRRILVQIVAVVVPG